MESKKCICPNCENHFEITSELFQEDYYPAYCIFCGSEMKLSYDFLKQYVARVQLRRSLSLGHYDDVIQTEDEKLAFESSFEVELDGDEVYLNGISDVKIYVQPYNNHYEIDLGNGLKFDVCFDTDEDLNRHCQLKEIVGENLLFKK